jgi:hypothetical protein
MVTKMVGVQPFLDALRDFYWLPSGYDPTQPKRYSGVGFDRRTSESGKSDAEPSAISSQPGNSNSHSDDGSTMDDEDEKERKQNEEWAASVPSRVYRVAWLTPEAVTRLRKTILDILEALLFPETVQFLLAAMCEYIMIHHTGER